MFHYRGMTVKKAAPRSAHRPSRRHEVLASTSRLCSIRPVGGVTVADIAAEAEMTPAAVYYHFPSKDAIVLEAVTSSGEAYVDALVDAVEDVSGGSAVDVARGVVDTLTAWAVERRMDAHLFFIGAAGYSPDVESVRRRLRAQAIDALAAAEARASGSTDKVMLDATATGIVVLLETAIMSTLGEDDVYGVLGPRRFKDEISRFAEIIVADD